MADKEPLRDSRQVEVPNHISANFPPRNVAKEAPKKAEAMKFALFLFFISTRAIHPMLIDLSKVDGQILYAKNTPVAMNKVMTIFLMNGCAFLFGGVEGLKQCWQPKTMLVFGMIGTVYAMGDFLEMMSMSKLSGGVYQVLLQTKLLITAVMLRYLKGTRQSSLQWHVLFAMFLAMSAFVLVDQATSSGGGAGGGSLPVIGLLCVCLKVAVSCFCAVLSDKYLKAFSNMPLFAKISGLATTWATASLIFASFEPQVQEHGFFHGWTTGTCLVAMSFTIKTVSTMYLLQALDSIQKNIGEALAVIVIYIAGVAVPALGKSFDLSVFLLAILVVALVKTYLISPKGGSHHHGHHHANKGINVVKLHQQGTDAAPIAAEDPR
mmetsp:Transcript_10057/g.22213  ORF Transcript_10057/g.22213 Transcript_10057/m.22213 type:complete len:379 (+) Transcript_10057:165-1301(+)